MILIYQYIMRFSRKIPYMKNKYKNINHNRGYIDSIIWRRVGYIIRGNVRRILTVDDFVLYPVTIPILGDVYEIKEDETLFIP